MRLLIAYALVVTVAIPLIDHHAAERDPWHGHLLRAGEVLGMVVHRHTYQFPHSEGATVPPAGSVLLVREANGLPAAGAVVTSPTSLMPRDMSAPEPAVRVTTPIAALVAPEDPLPGLVDPPPRRLR